MNCVIRTSSFSKVRNARLLKNSLPPLLYYLALGEVVRLLWPILYCSRNVSLERTLEQHRLRAQAEHREVNPSGCESLQISWQPQTLTGRPCTAAAFGTLG